jgi:WD40 repeat protein
MLIAWIRDWKKPEVVVWNISSREKRVIRLPRATQIHAIATSRQCDRIAMATSEQEREVQTVQVWDFARNEPNARWSVKNRWINGIQISCDGQYVATHSENRFGEYVAISRVKPKTTLFRTVQIGLAAMAFSPDGHLFACLREESVEEGQNYIPVLSLWDSERNKRLTIRLARHAKPQRIVDSLMAFSPDSRILAIGYQDGEVDLINLDLLWN